MITKLLIAVLLVCLNAATPALAAPPAPAPAVPAPSGSQKGSFFSNLEGASKQIASKVTTGLATDLKSTGVGIAAKLVKPALAIAGSLALLYLIVEVLRNMGTKSSMVTPLFDVGIPCILAAFLITKYADHIDSFDQVLDLFRTLGGPATGAVAGQGSDPTGHIMDMFGKIIATIGATIQQSIANLDFSFMKVVEASFYASVLDMLVTMIFALIIFVFVLVGMADVLGLLLMGPFLFAIGVAFGPLMIAGVVTPWTRDYFTKWVQFLVASAVLTGVIRVIMLIGVTLFDKLAIEGYAGSGTPTAVTMTIIAIMVMAINSLISQAPAIAGALVPGHLGATKGAGGDVHKASGMAKDNAKAVGTIAGRGVAKGAKLATSAIQKARAGGRSAPLQIGP